MRWELGVAGLAVGMLIAVVTAPVGVSGAVFLLPVQLSLFAVPNPAVTPTNLLYNVVAGPGALLRYRRDGALTGPLVRRLVLGTLPGVVSGAVIRVFALPGPRVFRLLVAALVLPLGLWLITRTLYPTPPESRRPAPRPRTVTTLALVVGVVGGIYGIDGGSILGPILVGRGVPIAKFAPAAACHHVAEPAGRTVAVASELAPGCLRPLPRAGRRPAVTCNAAVLATYGADVDSFPRPLPCRDSHSHQVVGGGVLPGTGA